VKNWLQYFRDDLSEIEEATDNEGAEIEMLSQLFMTEGYRKYIREWITEQIDKYEISPGEYADMLHATGIREGLRIVRDHLKYLESMVARKVQNG